MKRGNVRTRPYAESKSIGVVAVHYGHKDAAQKLGISLPTLRTYLNEGEAPKYMELAARYLVEELLDNEPQDVICVVQIAKENAPMLEAFIKGAGGVIGGRF